MPEANKVYTHIVALGESSLLAELRQSVGTFFDPFVLDKICPIPATAITVNNSQQLISGTWIRDNTGGLVVPGSTWFRAPGSFFFATDPAPAIPLVRTLSAKFPNVTICAWFYDRYASFAASAVFLAGTGLIRDVAPCSKEGRHIAAMTSRAHAIRKEKRAAKVFQYPSVPVSAAVPTPAVAPTANLKQLTAPGRSGV